MEDIRTQIIGLREEQKQIVEFKRKDQVAEASFAISNKLRVKEDQLLFLRQSIDFANLLRDMITPLIAVIVMLIALWISYAITGLVMMGGFVALYVTILFCVLGKHH